MNGKVLQRGFQVFLAVSMAVVLSSRVRADLLVYEPFDYATGTLNGKDGGTGFGGAWSTSSDNVTVSSTTQLGYTDAFSHSVDTAGYAGYVGRSSRSGSRVLSQGYDSANSSVLWMGLLMNNVENVTTYPDGGGNFRFVLINGTTERFSIGDLTNSSNNYGIQLHSASLSGNSTVSVLNNDVHLMVVRYDFGTGNNDASIHLFIDPENLGSEPALAAADVAFTGLSSSMSFNGIKLITAASNPSTETARARAKFDEIRIGETYFDVTTIPEPATAGLMIGGIALALLRRRRMRRTD